jgi:DUF1365 family protein
VTARHRLPASAVLYDCRVRHARRAPLRNVFRYRTCLWLVDAADVPRLGPVARFSAGDHLGDPRQPIAANVRRFAAANGIDLTGGRIRMLTTPRVAGMVFNPLTVYWCRAAGGALACVLAEVHNTYGQRHTYLLVPDERGRAEARKEFYVSPFYPVAGRYRMSLPEPGERLGVSVTYEPPDGPPFTAVLTGRAVPATWPNVMRLTVRRPLPGAVTAARIWWQGIGLFRRGLRPQPRPPRSPCAPRAQNPTREGTR